MGEEKYAFILIYILLFLIISFLQIKKVKEKEGYFLASRNLSSYLIFFTVLSTSIGSSSTFLLFFLISKYGFWGSLLEIGGGLGLIVLGLFFLKKIRKTNAYTLPEVLGINYGERVRFFSSAIVLISEVLWLSLVFKALQTIIHFDPIIIYPLIFSFILSVSISGQWGIAKTDVFYGILIFSGFFISYFFKTNKALEQNIFENINFNLLIFIFLSTFLTHIAGSDIWGKVLSAKDEKSGMKGTLFAGLGKIFWAILLFFIVSKFNVIPSGDETILNFISFFPKILSFILILSLISALLSSANSLLLTASTTFSNDLIKGFKRRKTLTLFLGLISFGIAHLSPDILFLFKKSYGFFALTISIPGIFFLLNLKIKENFLIICMLISGILSFLFLFNFALLISILFYVIFFSLNFKLRR